MGRAMAPLRTARMNHGCAAYTEGGRLKVMVAGGVSFNAAGQAVAQRSVEVRHCLLRFINCQQIHQNLI